MIGIEDIEAARVRIAPHTRHTPTLRMTGAKDALPVAGEVMLKLECLQVTGSFKARGAMNRLLGAPAADVANGIVTASGGNHGLAVARTAFAAGCRPPSSCPRTSRRPRSPRCSAGARGRRSSERRGTKSNDAALEFAKATGAAYFHPFADPLVVAGQGTLGLEILDDMPEIDTILVAIGGGGLISGLATAVAARRPDIRVIGIEPTAPRR